MNSDQADSQWAAAPSAITGFGASAAASLSVPGYGAAAGSPPPMTPTAAGLTSGSGAGGVAAAAAPKRSSNGMVKAEPPGANHFKRRLWQAEQWQREHAELQAALVERLQHLCQNTKNLDPEALSAELLRAVATYNRETADWCTTCGPSDDPCAFTRAQCTTCVAAKRRARKRPAIPAGECKKKQCEDCGLTSGKQAFWGFPDNRKMRWCSQCGKTNHPGSADLVNKPCEDCKLKSPGWGLASEGRKRWCAGCGAKHAGAVRVGGKKCKACHGPKPSWGVAVGAPEIWCSVCGKKNGGVICKPRRKVRAPAIQQQGQQGVQPPSSSPTNTIAAATVAAAAAVVPVPPAGPRPPARQQPGGTQATGSDDEELVVV